MLYRFNEISDEGLSLNLPLSTDWLRAECPDLEVKPAREGLTFRGHLSRQGDDAFLRGTLSGVLDCTCARCLEPARLPLRIPVAVSFVSKEEGDAGDDDEDDDDLDVAHFDGDEINIGPQLREQLLLTMPINPVCRETCAGLCPVCGGNRNQVPCDCVARQEIPKTSLGAALGKLKM
jgi:uncharacterized protein